MPRPLAGGFAESEQKVRATAGASSRASRSARSSTTRCTTVNFLFCHEDGDHGRRAGLRVARIFSYMASQLLSAKEVLPTRSYPSEGLLPALRREAGGPDDAAKSFKAVTMGEPDDVAVGDPAVGVGRVRRDQLHRHFMEVLPSAVRARQHAAVR